MIQVRIDVSGQKEIMAKLSTLDKRVRQQVLRKAVGAGGRKVQAAMKSGAPVSTDPRLVPGLLRLSLTTKVKAYRNSGIVVAIVGPRTNFDRQKKGRRRQLSAFGRRVARRAAKFGLSDKQSPSFYAHFAGPGRRQQFATKAAADLNAVRQVMMDELLRGVEEAAK